MPKVILEILIIQEYWKTVISPQFTAVFYGKVAWSSSDER